MQATIQCNNCGKPTKVNLPAKYCKFNITCKCGNRMRFDYTPSGLAPLPNQPQPQPQPADIGELEVSQTHDVLCPLCSGHAKVRLQKLGKQTVKCSACQGTLVVTAIRARTVNPFVDRNLRNAIIRVRKNWLARLFSPAKRMLLQPGPNIIGRHDSLESSDFSLTDKSVSRRSLKIEVFFEELTGYTFKLTVLKAANPVYHNGHELKVNEAIQLKFNDRIKVGKTMLEIVPNQI